jgi:hypothetical protein
MPTIHFKKYEFTRVGSPLTETDYHKYSKMGALEWEEYLSAMRSSCWRMFRLENRVEMQFLIWGFPILLGLLVIFQDNELMAAICGLILIGLFFQAIGFLKTLSSFSEYLKETILYLKEQRKLIVVSNDYGQYVLAVKKTNIPKIENPSWT